MPTAALADPGPDWIGDLGVQRSTHSILDPCQDPQSAQLAVDGLISGLRAVLESGSEETRLSRQVSLEALAGLRKLDAASVQVLCQQVAANPELTSRLSSLVVASRSSSNCFDANAYLSLLIVRDLLETLARILDGLCTSASCDPPAPAVLPRCVYTCIAPNVLRLIGLSFTITMQQDDKCSVLEHEEWMGRARAQSNNLLRDMGNNVFNRALPGMSNIGSNVVTGPAIDRLSGTVAGGFGLPTAPEAVAAAGTGIIPQIDALDGSLATASATQESFESRALAQMIETALASGITVVTYQLPESAGGTLEAVREVVARRLNGVSASGLSTAEALQFFRAGDAAFNAGQYAAAYAAYRQAYQSLQAGEAGDLGAGEP